MNWNMDPQKKDYVMVNGAPQETNSLTIPAYIRLKVKRTQWMYAPNNQYGSDFYLIKKRKTSQDATQLENIAAKALQPILDDGRANEITIKTTLANRNAVGLQTDIVDSSNNVQTIVLPSI